MSFTDVHPLKLVENMDVERNADFVKMSENKQELDPIFDVVNDINSNCTDKKEKKTTFVFDETSLINSVQSFPATLTLEDVFKVMKTDVRFMTTLVALKNLNIEFLQFLANSVTQCAGAYITFNEVTNNAFCNKQIVVSSFGRVGRSKKNLFKEMSHRDKRLSTDTKELTSAVKDFLGGLEKKLDEHGSLLKDHGTLLKDYANKLDDHANLLKDYKTIGHELLSRLLDLSEGKDNANVLCSLEPTRPVSSLADHLVKDTEGKENASPTHLSSTSPTEPMQLGSRASSEMDRVVKDTGGEENASPTLLSSTSPAEPMQLGSRASSGMDTN